MTRMALKEQLWTGFIHISRSGPSLYILVALHLSHISFCTAYGRARFCALFCSHCMRYRCWIPLDSTLSTKQQINTMCRACNLHIRQIPRIRQFLSQESVVQLVSCFIRSSWDYCNSLFIASSRWKYQLIKNVEKCAARLVLGTRKRYHITPAIKNSTVCQSLNEFTTSSLFSSTRTSALSFCHI